MNSREIIEIENTPTGKSEKRIYYPPLSSEHAAIVRNLTVNQSLPIITHENPYLVFVQYLTKARVGSESRRKWLLTLSWLGSGTFSNVLISNITFELLPGGGLMVKDKCHAKLRAVKMTNDKYSNKELEIADYYDEQHGGCRTIVRINLLLNEYQMLSKMPDYHAKRSLELDGHHFPKAIIMKRQAGLLFSRVLREDCLRQESLDKKISGKPLSRRVKLIIEQKILEALIAIHAHKIIHRDIKPDNIFIEGDVFTKGITEAEIKVTIVDFGLSVTVNTSTLGCSAGTPQFAAPEAYACQSADPKNDVYSFSQLLHEFWTSLRQFNRYYPLYLKQIPGFDQNPKMQADYHRAQDALRQGLTPSKEELLPRFDNNKLHHRYLKENLYTLFCHMHSNIQSRSTLDEASIRHREIMAQFGTEKSHYRRANAQSSYTASSVSSSARGSAASSAAAAALSAALPVENLVASRDERAVTARR